MSDLAQIIIVSLLSPAVLLAVGFFFASRAKKEDWRRQDIVADRAAKAAQAITIGMKETADQAQVAAKLLVINNEAVASTAAVTQSKLDVIHTLVNSNMTAAMQAELDATVRELAMMNEVIALNRAAGREPSKEALGAIVDTGAKIAELRAALADRLKQTQVAESQAAAAAAAAADE